MKSSLDVSTLFLKNGKYMEIIRYLDLDLENKLMKWDFGLSTKLLKIYKYNKKY